MSPFASIYLLYGLSAAVVLGFALWARAFASTLSSSLDGAQRTNALGRVRSASFLAFSAQLVLLGCQLVLGHRIRPHWILEPVSLFLLTFLLQGQIRFYLVKRIRDIAVSQWERLRFSFRLVAVMVGMYGL